MIRYSFSIALCCVFLPSISRPFAWSQQPDTERLPLRFINTAFENASPLWWEITPEGIVQIHLVYDQERSSPNRANGHLLFQVEADPGSDLTLTLGPFANIWNGQLSKPNPEAQICFVSEDGEHWRAIETEADEPYRIKFRIHMERASLYVARLPPYRLSNLDKLTSRIKDHPMVEISTIGHTVEGRDLELIRIGKRDAPRAVLLRARAHAWESGGNWVIEGLIERLLSDDPIASKCFDCYCVYVVPMANKDGVAGGRTRFNMLGMDLNRRWDRPADPALAPENAALEEWIGQLLRDGGRLDLAIDFHNDAGGKLHVSRPEIDSVEMQDYLKRMERMEQLLREHSWFTEGSTQSRFRNPGTIGEGLLARYGIHACIHELNANWIAGINDYPTAENWKQYGQQLVKVFHEYFNGSCDP